MKHLNKIALSVATCSLLLNAANNLDIRLGNEKWQLIGVNGCYDPAANSQTVSSAIVIADNSEKQFTNNDTEETVKITNEYGKDITAKVPDTINPDDDVPERTAVTTLTSDDGADKIFVEYSTAAIDEEVLITIDNTTYVLDLVSDDDQTILLSSLTEPIPVQCEITSAFRNNLANPTYTLGSGNDTLHIYSYDAENKKWLSYYDENTTNDFTEVTVGKAYWVKKTNDNNIFNDNHTGFRLSNSGVVSASYQGLPTGWNMVAFDNSSIRESSTGMIITAAAGTITITDHSGEYSTGAITLTTAGEVLSAAEINGAIQRGKLLGNLPNSFNLKAFATTTAAEVLLLCDNKFSIVTSVDMSPTKLSGDATTPADSTTEVTSSYGEYAVAIKQNSDNKFIQINQNDAVEFDSADLTKITADEDIDNAFAIKDTVGADLLYILVDKNAPFIVKDHTFTRVFTANSTQANVTADRIFKVDGLDATVTNGDARTAANLSADANATANATSDVVDGEIFRVVNVTNPDFKVTDSAVEDLFVVTSQDDINALSSTNQDKLKGAITKAYTLTSLAKLPVATGVDLNGDGDTNDTLATLSEALLGVNLNADQGTNTDDADTIDVFGLDEAVLNYDFNADGDQLDIVSSIDETILNADWDGDGAATNANVTFIDCEANVDLNMDGHIDGFDINGNGNKTDGTCTGFPAAVDGNTSIDIFASIDETNIGTAAGDEDLDLTGNVVATDTIALATGFYEGIAVDDNGGAGAHVDSGDLAGLPATIDFDDAAPIIADVTYTGIKSPDFTTANNPLNLFDSKVLRIYAASSNTGFEWVNLNTTVSPKNMYSYDYTLYQLDNSTGYWVYLGDAKTNDITIENVELQINYVHAFNNGIDNDADGDYDVTSKINTDSYIQAVVTGIGDKGSVEVVVGSKAYAMEKQGTTTTYKAYVGSSEDSSIDSATLLTINAYDALGQVVSTTVDMPTGPTTPVATVDKNSITVASDNATEIRYYNAHIDETNPTPINKFEVGEELYAVFIAGKQFGMQLGTTYFTAVNEDLAKHPTADIIHLTDTGKELANAYLLYYDSYVLNLTGALSYYNENGIEEAVTEDKTNVTFYNPDGTDPNAKLGFVSIDGILDTNVPLETWVTDGTSTIKLICAREYATRAGNRMVIKLNDKLYMTTFSQIFDSGNNNSTDGDITPYSESAPIDVSNAVFTNITTISGQNDI